MGNNGLQPVQRGARTGKRPPGTKHNAIQAYIMLAPLIAGFLVFTLYPILWSVRQAWFYYDSIPSHTRFVGWENFITLFTSDEGYWRALGNTFFFAFCKLPFEIPLALTLAILLNTRLRGRNLFRGMFYLPNIISTAIIGLIFSNMFSYYGVVNGIFERLGRTALVTDWFSKSAAAMIVVVIASIWQTFGINMIYFLAALQNIPLECYECARLDGAGKLVTFFRITLPLIAPTAKIIMMLAINGTLMTSDLILVLTNGGPGGGTEVVMTYLLKHIVPGFAASDQNIGYGAAMAVTTALVLAAVSIIYLRATRKENPI